MFAKRIENAITWINTVHELTLCTHSPYNWNPSPNATEYCSWDTPTTKTCKTHHYEQGLIHLAHAAGAEVYPSLGGWSLSDPFPEMAASEVARRNFVENCVQLIVDHDFDGLDIDWEVRLVGPV